MPSARTTEKRDAAIVSKFAELYQEGMKKNHVYGLLAKEYGVQPERIAEIIAAARDEGREIHTSQFKSKPDRPAPLPITENLLFVRPGHANVMPPLPSSERNKRDAAIRRKFQKIYREGMKKYYIYARLAEEYGLLSERIAEIVRERKQRIKGQKNGLQHPRHRRQRPR